MKKLTTKDIKNLYKDQERYVHYYPSYRRQCSSTIKDEVYFKKGEKCAEEACFEKKMDQLTVDHILPISVAFYLNWRIDEVRDLDNLQMLCKAHHKKKDNNVKSILIPFAKKLRLSSISSKTL